MSVETYQEAVEAAIKHGARKADPDVVAAFASMGAIASDDILFEDEDGFWVLADTNENPEDPMFEQYYVGMKPGEERAETEPRDTDATMMVLLPQLAHAYPTKTFTVIVTDLDDHEDIAVYGAGSDDAQQMQWLIDRLKYLKDQM